jgi:hypothetical protein
MALIAPGFAGAMRQRGNFGSAATIRGSGNPIAQRESPAR